MCYIMYALVIKYMTMGICCVTLFSNLIFKVYNRIHLFFQHCNLYNFSHKNSHFVSNYI